MSEVLPGVNNSDFLPPQEKMCVLETRIIQSLLTQAVLHHVRITGQAAQSQHDFSRKFALPFL